MGTVTAFEASTVFFDFAEHALEAKNQVVTRERLAGVKRELIAEKARVVSQTGPVPTERSNEETVVDKIHEAPNIKARTIVLGGG